jgi:hypothetical protein
MQSTCRASLFLCEDSLDECFETWIAPQQSEKRIDPDESNICSGVIFIALLQPAERFFFSFCDIHATDSTASG